MRTSLTVFAAGLLTGYAALALYGLTRCLRQARRRRQEARMPKQQRGWLVPGAVTTDLWCERCDADTAVTFAMWRLLPDGVAPYGRLLVCTRCRVTLPVV